MHSSLIFGVIYLVLALLVLVLTKSLLGVILAYIGSNVVYAFLAFFLSLKLLHPRFRLQLPVVRKILKLSFPLWVSSVFAMVNSKVCIFLLASLKSDYEVGIYTAAYRFLEMAGLLGAMLMNPIVPIFSEKAVLNREELRQNWAKIAGALAVFLIPVGILSPYLSPLLVRLVFGEAFAESAKVLNVLAWVGVLVFFGLLSSALNLSLGVVRHGYWNMALATFITIVLNYLWIPRYSYLGSAWAACNH